MQLFWISFIILIVGVLLIILNMVNKLRISVQFYSAVKYQRCILCSAEILEIRTSANSRGSIKYATAKYTINGKQIIGLIICTYGGPIPIRQQRRVNVMVNPYNINLYAFSEEHVKDALLTYSILSLLACATFIALIVCMFKFFV